MLASLDKYSEFIDPERFKLIKIAMKGEYAGIGAILATVGLLQFFVLDRRAHYR